MHYAFVDGISNPSILLGLTKDSAIALDVRIRAAENAGRMIDATKDYIFPILRDDSISLDVRIAFVNGISNPSILLGLTKDRTLRLTYVYEPPRMLVA